MATALTAAWPNQIAARIGPFQDGSGNLWAIVVKTTISAVRSTDGGATWDTQYDQSVINARGEFDCVFDFANGLIYVVAIDSGSAARILSFNVTSHVWTAIDGATSRPSISGDVNGKLMVFLTRRSTGEFVIFYQGNLHSMGNDYRSVYYARCSAAGVWSSSVAVAALKNTLYDAKSAVLGDSDRFHMIYNPGAATMKHRSLSSANGLDTEANAGTANATTANYYNLYYNNILAKIVFELDNGIVHRATSAANPTWTADANAIGSPENGGSPAAWVYDLAGEKLYVFYRDATSDDVYVNAVQKSDVNQLTGGSSNYIMGGLYAAQEFTPTRSYSLSILGLSLSKTGSPPNGLLVEIRQGSPTGTLLASETIQASELGTLAYYGLKFASPPALNSGTKYCIVLSTTSGDVSNCYAWGRSTTDVYANNDAWVYNTGSWSTQTGYDMVFTAPGGTIWPASTQQDAATSVVGISVGLIGGLVGPDTISSTYFGNTSTFMAVEQSFTAPTSCTLLSVIVKLAKSNAPTDDVIVELQSDNGSGAPSGTVLATIGTITGSTLPTTLTDQKFACNVSLTGGTRYHIVIRRSGEGSLTNRYIVGNDSWLANETAQSLDNGSWTLWSGQDLRLVLGTSLSAIGILYSDNGVYFDKFTLTETAPPEPVPPETTNEEFFILL